MFFNSIFHIAAADATGQPQAEELPRFDISLLAGQVLRVKVSNVERVTKFHIQLPSAAASDKIIDAYMADKDHMVRRKNRTKRFRSIFVVFSNLE